MIQTAVRAGASSPRSRCWSGSARRTGPIEWLAAAGVLALIAFAISWLSVACGMAAKSVETASNMPMPLILLPFLGSGFVPTDSMPTAIRWFAEYQPFTPVMETVRGLLLGTAIGNSAVARRSLVCRDHRRRIHVGAPSLRAQPASVTPFRVAIPEADLVDLRDRLARTRWPEPETVDDWSQGVPLAYLRELCGYWADGYDWRATEAAAQRAAAVPHHDRRARHPLPARAFAAPGRPAVGPDPRLARLGRRVPQGGRPLTDPRRLRGELPRGDPVAARLRVQRPAGPAGLDGRADRGGVGVADGALGYDRYGAAGHDWGTSVTHEPRRSRTPAHVAGIHLVPPLAPPDPDTFDDLTPTEERAALADWTRAAGVRGRLLAGAVHPAADHRVRAGRLARRAVRLDRGEVPDLDRLRR